MNVEALTPLQCVVGSKPRAPPSVLEVQSPHMAT